VWEPAPSELIEQQNIEKNATVLTKIIAQKNSTAADIRVPIRPAKGYHGGPFTPEHENP
jgi:hypothetical protein